MTFDNADQRRKTPTDNWPTGPSLRGHATRLALLLTLALTLRAAERVEIQLDLPKYLAIGNVYEATVNVVAAEPIPVSYVKLSLPSALEVVEGATSYRGQLHAGLFQLKVRFRAAAASDGVIMARLLILDGNQQVLAGRAQVRYCSPDSSGITVSLDRPLSTPEYENQTRAASDIGALEHLADVPNVLHEARRGNLRTPLLLDRVLVPNSSLSGRLLPGATAAYRFEGRRGHRVWISAESSDFDTLLWLVGPDGTILAENDDGLGVFDSRIPQDGVLELSQDGAYFVAVTSFQANGGGDFRITLHDFTVFERDLQAVAPPKSAEQSPQAATAPRAAVSLSGRIVYVAADGTIAPVRHAVVRLFSEGFLSDTEVAAVRSDINGNVTLSVPDAHRNSTLFIRAYTTDAGIGIASVQDPLFGLHSARRASFTLPNSASVTFGTFNVASEGKNAPFLVYDAVVEGYLIARDVLQRTPPMVSVKYPVRNFLGLFTEPYDIDAHYAGSEITLGEYYGSSPDVVLHEYGHFLADVNRFNQTQGGTHVVPFYQRVNPSLAWGEGWASMFAVAGQMANGNPSKRTFVSSHPNITQRYDMDDGHATTMIREAVAGDDNEGSVQFVLWDLFDSIADSLPIAGGVDSVALSIKTIFDVARGGVLLVAQDGSVQTYAVDHLEKFYGALLQTMAFQPAQHPPIAAIFTDQRIRWELPPPAPSNLRFSSEGSQVRLEWQATANALAYSVERRLPGQTSFTTLTSTTEPFARLGLPVIGTSYRVYSVGANSARFIAPFVSPPSQEISLTTLPTSPAISLSVTQLSFDIQPGSVSSAQSVVVSNSGSGTLRWQVQANVPWISASPGSGTAPSTIAVTVNASTLAPGTYSGILTVSSADAAAKTIGVTVTVRASNPNSVQIDSVVSGASFGLSVAPSGWITIIGKNLARTSRVWRDSEIVAGRLPTSLDGVSVSIGGKSAFVYYISPVQINVQAPSEINVDAAGTSLEVRVVSPDGTATSVVRFTPIAPALFTYPVDGQVHAAAVHTDGVLVGPEGAIPTTVTRAAKPDDVLLLYATGLGLNTDPPVPAGAILAEAAPLRGSVTVTVGGFPARVLFAGLVSPGLYQLNVVVPAAPVGAQPVRISISGVLSETEVRLMIKR